MYQERISRMEWFTLFGTSVPSEQFAYPYCWGKNSQTVLNAIITMLLENCFELLFNIIDIAIGKKRNHLLDLLDGQVPPL